jgi:hypothetical protein
MAEQHGLSLLHRTEIPSVPPTSHDSLVFRWDLVHGNPRFSFQAPPISRTCLGSRSAGQTIFTHN